MVNDFDAGQRQRTFLQNFGLVVASRMFHGHEDAFRACHKIHRAAHAFQHFPWDRPVRERSLFIDLQRAENGEIDVAAADHGKRISGGKITGAAEFANRFFAGVDQVGIDFGIERIGADAEHAIFRVQDYFHAFGHIVGDQRGHPDSEVDVVTVA